MATTEKNFELHEIATAPEASRPVMEGAQAAFGMVPNLHKVLAESPAALEAYGALWEIFGRSGLTAAERQVVYLTSNYENECRYCMAGHTVLAKGDGVPEQAVQAIRDGAPIDDPKLEALRRFTSGVVTQRGWVSDAEVAAFLEAGFTRANVLDVILGVSVKVISNYANHVAETPLDGFMAETQWTPPRLRDAA